jgi:hypothetical protein
MRPFSVLTHYPLKDESPAEYELPDQTYYCPNTITHYVLFYSTLNKFDYQIKHMLLQF